MRDEFIFTSESVTEGHPDKVCDYIADTILDACLAQDTGSHVACEVLCKGGHVTLAGEISPAALSLDYDRLVRGAIREIGYTDPAESFCADTVAIHEHISLQSAEINQGVDKNQSLSKDQGAGDQGIMFGYATNETPTLMPLPILLAHALSRQLSNDRKSQVVAWLRPDGKTQVSVDYVDGKPVRVTDVVVSTQHSPDVNRAAITEYVRTILLPAGLGEWFDPAIRLHVNPTGSFILGGPSADCGVTGRKIIVDTYGGFARHGGGAFSGKDPSKVDRSATYFCRHVARELVKAGLAERAEIQVGYAIGEPQPVSVKVDTFGTGDAAAAAAFVKGFDFRPAAIIEKLDLLRPLYRQTTNYGHFGKPGLPWEQ
jgi:S-adenosylmethionine synthetase